MVHLKPKTRIPWEDRFRTPTSDELTVHYNRQQAALFEQARAELGQLGAWEERITWQGVAWRWSVTFHERAKDGDRPRLYLVPHPDGPTIAAPISDEDAKAVKPRQAKFLLEGIQAARVVGDVRWATWRVQNKSNLAEVLELARRQLAAPQREGAASRPGSAQRPSR